MKESIIGGIFTARSYRHISEYEKEILRLKKEGKTLKEIGERLGFTREQIHNFITRYNEKQRKIAAGIVIKKKGRPSKDYQISEKDSAARLRYIIDRKDAKLIRLTESGSVSIILSNDQVIRKEQTYNASNSPSDAT